LGAAALLADLAFGEVESFEVDGQAESQIGTAGEWNGVLLFFEAELAPGQWLSTAPEGADAANHWHSPLWLTSRGRKVAAGDRVRLRYRYRGGESYVELE
jgi:hypothetical protein